MILINVYSDEYTYVSVTGKMKGCTLDLCGAGLIPAPVRVITEMNFGVR